MADLSHAIRHEPLAAAHGGSGSVRLTPARPASRISLRARSEAVGALSSALGIDLPTKPLTSTIADARMALWLGPDEWLMIDENGADLMAAAASAGVMHAAVDVSHRNTAIIVSGPGADVAINSGCPQDLSLSACPVGKASRTILGKAEIVLLRLSEDTFRVECWRSFSPFVFGLLAEGANDAS